MRLLICLAILAFVRCAPINDETEDAAQEQIAPEGPVPEEITPPEEPKEVFENLVAPENEPASEEPVNAEEEPASEESATAVEEPASEEPLTVEEEPIFEEQVTLDFPEASEEKVTEVLSIQPIAPESEPIPETHEESAPDSLEPEAPIEIPYEPVPESHNAESYEYNPITPSLSESEIILPETTFIDDLLWALFGDDDENDTDIFDFLWPFSEPEHQTSAVNYHAASPVQAKGEVIFAIWSG